MKLWKCYKYGNYMYKPKIKCLWSLELLSFYYTMLQSFMFRELLLGEYRCCFELKLLPTSSIFSLFYCLIIASFYLKLLLPSASFDFNLSIIIIEAPDIVLFILKMGLISYFNCYWPITIFFLGNIFTPLDKPTFKSLNVELRFVLQKRK